MRSLEFRPLGGPSYRGKFWPLSSEQVAYVESVIGWQLPSDFREFVTQYGASRTEPYVMLPATSTGYDDDIAVELFPGAEPTTSTSIVENAPHFCEPNGYLTVVYANNGVFYMNSDGRTLFERHFDPDPVQVADSFTDFLEKLVPDPDLLD